MTRVRQSAAARSVPGAAGGAAPELLTIDGLSAQAGVPSRTIRFYQTQGALPPPLRRGRIALYTAEHMERLRLIEMFQKRGLRLSAIVDLVRRDPHALSVSQWLGVDARLMAPWSDDEPVIMSRDELLEAIAPRGEQAITILERMGLVHQRRSGHELRYEVRGPALLQLTLQLDDAGVGLSTAAGAGAILAARLAPAADELVRHFAEHAGRGFGRRLSPEELTTALAALRPLGVEAVRLIFAREMERALRTLVADGGPASRRPARGARSSPRRGRRTAAV